jgi:hypothetical protein
MNVAAILKGRVEGIFCIASFHSSGNFGHFQHDVGNGIWTTWDIRGDSSSFR